MCVSSEPRRRASCDARSVRGSSPQDGGHQRTANGSRCRPPGREQRCVREGDSSSPSFPSWNDRRSRRADDCLLRNSNAHMKAELSVAVILVFGGKGRAPDAQYCLLHGEETVTSLPRDFLTFKRMLLRFGHKSQFAKFIFNFQTLNTGERITYHGAGFPHWPYLFLKRYLGPGSTTLTENVG